MTWDFRLGWRAVVGGCLLVLLVVGCRREPTRQAEARLPEGPRGSVKLVDLPLKAVQIDDSFWSPRIETNRSQTLNHAYQQVERTGAIRNFDIAAGKIAGKFSQPWWSDSDVYKWLEGASYSLANHPDPQLQARVDEVIAKIAAAQQKNGYLDTFIQGAKPLPPFTYMAFSHELFCAGHLLEAAVAHYEATGKRTLLDVAVRLADHLDATFGPGKRDGTSGHEEVELALVKLYRATGEKRYLRLAQFFVDQRGQKPSYFQREYDRLPPDLTLDFLGRRINVRDLPKRFFLVDPAKFDTSYCQDHLPVRQQTEAVGHAVRATYLYSAMADLVYETGDQEMLQALNKLHDSVTLRRMYVTGGIGPSEHNEGFTSDYDLPNEHAYQETCATIGLVLWNHRMLKLTGDGRYADLMELSLYNAFAGGVSLAGNTFCYVTPLYSKGDLQRHPWFGVPCCPTNVVRILPSLGKYAYSQSDDGLWVNLYVGGKTSIRLPGGAEVTLRQSAKYPWEGDVRLEVGLETPQEFTIHLRLPGWSSAPTIRVNGRTVNPPVAKGYAMIRRRWSKGDVTELSLPMEIQRLEAHPNVMQNRGKTALRRGPLIYCLEQIDNEADLDRIVLPVNSKLESYFEPQLLNGIAVITGEGLQPDASRWGNQLYLPLDRIGQRPVPLKAVPYCVWGNRGQAKMKVWIDLTAVPPSRNARSAF